MDPRGPTCSLFSLLTRKIIAATNAKLQCQLYKGQTFRQWKQRHIRLVRTRTSRDALHCEARHFSMAVNSGKIEKKGTGFAAGFVYFVFCL